MIRQTTQRKASQWQRLLQLLDSWRAKRVLGVLPTNVNYVWHFLVLFFDTLFGSFWHMSHILAHLNPKTMKPFEFGRLVIPLHSLHHFTPPDPLARAIAKVRPFRPDRSVANEAQSLMEPWAG